METTTTTQAKENAMTTYTTDTVLSSSNTALALGRDLVAGDRIDWVLADELDAPQWDQIKRALRDRDLTTQDLHDCIVVIERD